MIQHTIPFYSQHWDLEKWKESGFQSREDAEYWQYSSCGVLCLAMVIQKMNEKPISVSELITKGKEIGAYNHHVGWSHDGLVQLAKEYGIQATRRENLSQIDLERLLKEDNVIIVSIKWAFKDIKSLRERVLFWRKKGGHLALVTGYDSGYFTVHHTSVLPEYNWENRQVPQTIFRKSFTGRGIILNIKGK